MKKVLLTLLVLHIILEGLVGSMLVISPTTLVAGATDNEVSGLIVQGMCALSTVILALWLIPYRHSVEALTVGLGTLAVFHSLLILSLAFTMPEKEALAGYAHHLVLALGFWLCWCKRRAIADQ